MAWTQADIDKLKTAIATGAESATSSDGKSVTLRPQEELFELLRRMETEVAPSTYRQPASFVAGFKRDL